MILPRVPPVITSLPILRPDWEILTRLASSRSKLSDLDACPVPSSLHRFCGTTDKPKPAWFWGPSQETVAVILSSKPVLSILRTTPENPSHRFWGQTKENSATSFEVKPEKTIRMVLRLTKKHVLLIYMCMVQTTHGTTRPLDHPSTE
jgi:hypothetical protein